MYKEDQRFYMASVKLGPKGQIVIPKEVRDMFGVAPGDTMVLLADRKKGVALQTVGALNPMLRRTFQSICRPDGDDGEEEV